MVDFKLDSLATLPSDGDNEPPADPSTLSYLEPTESAPWILGKLNHDPSPEKVAEELEINTAIDEIRSDDEKQQLHGSTKLRQIINKILHDEDYPIVSNTIIHSGIIGRCIQFLKREQSPDLQFEAAWILTNIASGTSEDTKEIVEAGAVEPLINLLKSSNSKVADQGVWTLGNIAGEGAEMRDHLISKGILPPLIALAEKQTKVPFLKNIAWTISNICRVPPKVPVRPETYPCLPVLIRMAQQGIGQLGLLYHVLWGLHYLTQDGNEDFISQIVASGIIPQLVQTLTHQDDKVIDPCLLVLGNIVSSNSNPHTDAVLEAGILPFLGTLIQNPNFEKETTWLVSNIAAGTMAQRSILIAAGILPRVIEVLGSELVASQKEAAYTVLNIIVGGSVDQIRLLINFGVIPPMIRLLDSDKSGIVIVVLDALKTGLEIFRLIHEEALIIKLIEESGGFKKLGNLQSHENDSISL